MPQGHEIALLNTSLLTVSNRTGEYFGLFLKAAMTDVFSQDMYSGCLWYGGRTGRFIEAPFNAYSIT